VAAACATLALCVSQAAQAKPEETAAQWATRYDAYAAKHKWPGRFVEVQELFYSPTAVEFAAMATAYAHTECAVIEIHAKPQPDPAKQAFAGQVMPCTQLFGVQTSAQPA
jgi:opacity protein-like surface antigen